MLKQKVKLKKLAIEIGLILDNLFKAISIRSAYGEFELETPRDRNGGFEPDIVKKRQIVLTDEIDQKRMKLFS